MSPPHVSLLLAVDDQPYEDVRDTIESVRHQTWLAWELCVAAADPRPGVADVLRHYAHHDPRVLLVTPTAAFSSGSRTAQLASCLAWSCAPWVGVLGSGDLLAAHCLRRLLMEARRQPTAVVHADEDTFDAHSRRDAVSKPGWSPDQLLAEDYLGRLTLLRRSLVLAAGGFLAGTDGAEEWDLHLRATEIDPRVSHVDEVLYHRRAGVPALRAPVATAAVLRDALRRRGQAGTARAIPGTGCWQVRRDLDQIPSVSVVLPTAGARRSVRGVDDVSLVAQCARGLVERTDYPVGEVVLVLSEHADERAVDEARAVLGDRLVVERDEGAFSFSRSINRGALRATGDLLLLLNDDIYPVHPDWLRLLVEALQEPGVGVVGPRLLYEDATVQHAGVQHSHGLPFHLQRHAAVGAVGYGGEIVSTRNYLAVTGAVMLTARDVFLQLGGLSDTFPVNYGDMDYCLKARTRGLRTTYVGQSVLTHFESASRDPSVSIDDIEKFRRAWRTVTEPDPYLPIARIPDDAP